MILILFSRSELTYKYDQIRRTAMQLERMSTVTAIVKHLFIMQGVVFLAAAATVGTSLVNASPCTPKSPFPMPLCNGIRIEDAPIATLQAYMSSGQLTSEELVQCYLRRIEQTNE
jgi:hypothetical protein